MLLFGDSITQFSCSQDNGFALTPALQNGTLILVDAFTFWTIMTFLYVIFALVALTNRRTPYQAFIRRLDIINRGFSVRKYNHFENCRLLRCTGLQYVTSFAHTTRIHAETRAGAYSLYGLNSIIVSFRPRAYCASR